MNEQNHEPCEENKNENENKGQKSDHEEKKDPWPVEIYAALRKNTSSETEYVEAVELLTEMDEKADKVIAGYLAGSTLTALLPIPLADAPLLAAQQMAMMNSIQKAYQLNIPVSDMSNTLLQLLSVTGTTILGKSVTGALFKLIPGAGSAAGAGVCAAAAGSITGLLGQAWKSMCRHVAAGAMDKNALKGKEAVRMLKDLMAGKPRLEYKIKEEDKDVLKTSPIPSDDLIFIMPEASQKENLQDGQEPMETKENVSEPGQTKPDEKSAQQEAASSASPNPAEDKDSQSS